VVLDGELQDPGVARIEGEELVEAPRASPAHGADVVEQVVLDEDAPRLPAGEVVVRGEDVEPAPGVTEDVLPERHVFDRAPRCAAVLVADGGEDGAPRPGAVAGVVA